VSKKNTYSAVWTFFGLKKDQNNDDDELVMCHLCQSVVLAQGGNTNNLFRHHAKEYVSIEKGQKKQKSNNEETAQITKQITLGETIKKIKPYTCSS